jgi:type I restriction enzyme S subunit
MSEWRETTLGEVSTDISYGYTASANSENIGPKFLRITDIVPDRINWETVPYCEIEEKKNEQYQLEIGDIVIARTGATTGYNKVIKENINSVFASYLIRYKIDKDIASPEFIGYCLQSSIWKGFVEGIIGGSAQPGANAKQFASFDISLPPLEEQKAIAEVLSSLDDKIDLLHQQNKTLEELAQTLFRQWFIEEASDDWEEKPLSKIATFLNGLACQKFPPHNDIDKLPVLKIKDLKAGISNSSDWATNDVKPEYIIESGDVVFAWSASLMVKIWDGEKCVLNQHLFKVSSEQYPKWFYYQWCKYHLDRFIAIAQAHATTMGHIKRKDLDNAMCFIPSEDELKDMSEQMNPLMEKMETNSKQIKTLENMRDTLLPKLMSGEVRVKHG